MEICKPKISGLLSIRKNSVGFYGAEFRELISFYKAKLQINMKNITRI